MDDSRPLRAATPLRPLPKRESLARRARRSIQKQIALARRPRIEVGWVSECGLDHSRNQDAVLVERPFFAVADGVGGGSAGELASSQMLAYCSRIPAHVWKRTDHLSAWLKQSDRVIEEALRALEAPGPSATTFAGLWLQPDGRANLAHVGDARLMHLERSATGWHCEGLTTDQTYRNLGEEPPPGGSPDDPARMVGVGAIGEPAVRSMRLREGRIILACTDGLHRFLTPEQISNMVQTCDRSGSSLTLCAAELVAGAQRAGSRDDVSALVVRLNPRFGARGAFWQALGAIAVVCALATGWQAINDQASGPAGDTGFDGSGQRAERQRG